MADDEVADSSARSSNGSIGLISSQPQETDLDEDKIHAPPEKSPISRLMEYASRKGLKVEFEEFSSQGDSPLKFGCVCLVNGVKYPQGMGNSKKVAKTNAASIAFDQLCKNQEEKSGLKALKTYTSSLLSMLQSVDPESNLQLVSPESNLQSVSPESNLQSVCPESNLQLVSPESNLQSVGPESKQQLVSPESNQQLVSPESKQQLVSPESKQQLVSPESNQQLVSPESKQQLVSPESKQQLVSPESKQQLVSPESNLQLVSPESKQQLVSPESNLQLVGPESMQLSQLIQSFVYGGKQPVSCINEYAALKKIDVEFQSDDAKDSITKKFTCTCIMDGVSYPKGVGYMKKEAKTNAAINAFSEVLGIKKKEKREEVTTWAEQTIIKTIAQTSEEHHQTSQQFDSNVNKLSSFLGSCSISGEKTAPGDAETLVKSRAIGLVSEETLHQTQKEVSDVELSTCTSLGDTEKHSDQSGLISSQPQETDLDEDKIHAPPEKSPISRLMEEYASRKGLKVEFEEFSSQGDSPLKFGCVCLVNGVKYPQGMGNSKKVAKTNAASIAFDQLCKNQEEKSGLKALKTYTSSLLSMLQSVDPESNLQLVSPESNLQSVSPESNLQSVCPESNLQLVSPESNLQSVGPESKQQLVSPESNQQLVSPESKQQLVSPESKQQLVSPESNQQLVSPESKQQLVSPESKQQLVSPESKQQLVSPESNLQLVSPESKQQLVSPESNLQLVGPESMQLSQLIQSFVYGGKQPVSCINEYAALKKIDVEFQSDDAKDSITKKFTCTCIMDGVSYPKGVGYMKKEAKTNAAINAFSEVLGIKKKEKREEVTTWAEQTIIKTIAQTSEEHHQTSQQFDSNVNKLSSFLGSCSISGEKTAPGDAETLVKSRAIGLVSEETLHQTQKEVSDVELSTCTSLGDTEKHSDQSGLISSQPQETDLDEDKIHAPPEKSPISRLMEEYASRKGLKVEFEEFSSQGDSPLKFGCVCLVNGVKYPQGMGNSKKVAKTNAASIAFDQLCKNQEEKSGLKALKTYTSSLLSMLQSVDPESNLQLVSPESNLQSVSPESNLQSVCPESNLQLVSPESNLQSVGPESKQQLVSPESNQQLVSPESKQQLVSPESKQQLVSPESNQQLVSPESKQQLVSPESKQQLVSPESKQQLVSPESNLQLVSPESKQQLVSPESNLQLVGPESMQLSQLIQSFVYGGKQPVSCINEYAALKKIDVEFQSDDAKDSITKKFTCTCIMDGVSYPKGVGYMKKEAKTNAAINAFSEVLGIKKKEKGEEVTTWAEQTIIKTLAQTSEEHHQTSQQFDSNVNKLSSFLGSCSISGEKTSPGDAETLIKSRAIGLVSEETLHQTQKEVSDVELSTCTSLGDTEKHSDQSDWFDEIPTNRKKEKPSDRDLSRVANALGRGWEYLALNLDLSTVQVDQVKMSAEKPIIQITNTLIKWKQCYPKKATFETIVKALQDSNNACTIDWDGVMDVVKGDSEINNPHARQVQAATKTHSSTQQSKESIGFKGFAIQSNNQLKKGIDDTADVAHLREVVNFAESVGRIVTPSGTGTGFRVGERCIMTAYHVLKHLLEGKDITLDSESPIFNRDDVYIDFDYKEDGERNMAMQYNFCREIYCNPDFDTLVLELNLHDRRPPPPQVTFKTMFNKEDKITFVGHDQGRNKRLDPSCSVVVPTLKEIQDGNDHCKRIVGIAGYDDLLNENFERFHCRFEKGASGAPGLVFDITGKVFVTIMLLRGYPCFYWDLDPGIQKSIPENFLLEEGISMERIARDMKVNNENAFCLIFCNERVV